MYSDNTANVKYCNISKTQNTCKTRRAQLKNNAREKMEGSTFQRPAMMLTAQYMDCRYVH